MYGIRELRAINRQKHASALKWAHRPPRRHDRDVTVFVFTSHAFTGKGSHGGSLTVADGRNAPICPQVDRSILYINSDDGREFYINHEAGFQRFHKDGCSRLEALGYAKQAGVSQEKFIEAFGGRRVKERDPDRYVEHFPVPAEHAVAVIIVKKPQQPEQKEFDFKKN